MSSKETSGTMANPSFMAVGTSVFRAASKSDMDTPRDEKDSSDATALERNLCKKKICGYVSCFTVAKHQEGYWRSL